MHAAMREHHIPAALSGASVDRGLDCRGVVRYPVTDQPGRAKPGARDDYGQATPAHVTPMIAPSMTAPDMLD